MRILVLTSQPPYPPHQGAAARNLNIIRHLAGRHEMHLLTLVSTGQSWSDRGPLPELCASVTTVPTPPYSMLKRLINVFASTSPDLIQRHWSPHLKAALLRLTQSLPFDVIQVENLEMAQYVAGPMKLAGRPLVVLDEHNAEYVLQQRAFHTDLRRPSKWIAAFYSYLQWKKLRRFEQHACRAADMVIAVSEADQQALLDLDSRLDVRVVPNGVDTDYFVYRERDASSFIKRPSIVFTGTMDFRPNVDGVLWFCQDVLPHLRRRVPNLRLYIVGKRPNRAVRGLISEYITVTGAVEDVRPYFKNATACVVPLRMGGGTRLKVLEAMASGTPVVSTNLGVEGLEVRDGVHALLADDPAGLASRVLELIVDRQCAQTLSTTARALVEEKYDWRLIVPRLEDCYVERRTIPADKVERTTQRT
ncbi:MAG: glycosyltransferase [Chloroflexota bacterium]|nr:MAG: glycosyltransferase [Chloroflexota bacterium]